jgi:hypothetical protein
MLEAESKLAEKTSEPEETPKAESKLAEKTSEPEETPKAESKPADKTIEPEEKPKAESKPADKTSEPEERPKAESKPASKANKLEEMLKGLTRPANKTAAKKKPEYDEEAEDIKGKRSGDEEEEGTNAYRVTEAAINAMKNTVPRADSDTPPAKVNKQQGQKIEERLESLARMYEMKRTQKSKEEEDAGNSHGENK